jgi:hypothetical protein
MSPKAAALKGRLTASSSKRRAAESAWLSAGKPTHGKLWTDMRKTSAVEAADYLKYFDYRHSL